MVVKTKARLPKQLVSAFLMRNRNLKPGQRPVAKTLAIHYALEFLTKEQQLPLQSIIEEVAFSTPQKGVGRLVSFSIENISDDKYEKYKTNLIIDKYFVNSVKEFFLKSGRYASHFLPKTWYIATKTIEMAAERAGGYDRLAEYMFEKYQLIETKCC